jgi:hypothetical protein
MFSLASLVTLIIYIIIGGLVFWLLWWLVNYINPPEPFKKIATVVLAIAGVLFLIGCLLNFIGISVVR